MEKKIISFVLYFCFGIFFLLPNIAFSASLDLSPLILTRSVGDIFSVSVNVSSSDKAINAVSGVVSFSPSVFEVISISKTNSIINLWVEEPSFSNKDGTINFEGVALNPGFLGSHGTIISVNFKAKNPGQGKISFSSGAILANDGAGTNILSSMGSSNLTINSGVKVEEKLLTNDVVNDNNLLVIKSTSHPDQSKWYSDNSPEFSWVLPDDAIEVKTLIGVSSTALPSVRYLPPISSKKIDQLPDGVYYFSLQIRTSNDGWGNVARYRVNIDTTPPDPFLISFPHGKTGWEPQPVIIFNTTDDTSGVRTYDVKIGDGGPERIAPTATSNPYPLPKQYPGDHIVTITAVDEAGNTRSASENFTIQAIDRPTITSYQDEIESGDIVKIRGTTYPDSDITILFKERDEVIFEEHTRSNSSGDWAVVATKRFSPGPYVFTARVTDGRGAQSDETEPLTIIVKSKFLTDLINIVLDYLSAIILIGILLAVFIGGGVYAWNRTYRVLRKFKRESREAEKILEKSFRILRKDIATHITRLKSLKRKLTKEEISFLEQFDNELGEAEEAIANEIKDISHS